MSTQPHGPHLRNPAFQGQLMGKPAALTGISLL